MIAKTRRNKRATSALRPDNTWLWGAAVNLLLCVAFLLFFLCVAALSASAARADWSFQSPIKWGDDENEKPPVYTPKQEPVQTAHDRPKPPDVQPFKIPTYDGKEGDFRSPVPELAEFPDIDTEAIYKVVVNCFPERVPWGLEVDLVAGARYTDGSNNNTAIIDSSSINQFNSISKYYGGIVARMPLYSASEINSERREEYQRRTKLSDNVAKLVASLASIRRAWREIGLFTAATIRSQKRVESGVADTSEQVGYVEKVASAYSSLDSAKAELEAARLALYGQCRDEVADQVNDYLKAVISNFVKRAKIGQK